LSDQQVARDVRREVERAGGSQWFPVRAVRDAFGRTTLTRKARSEIADALAGVGVRADPELDAVSLKDRVRLYVLDPARDPRPDETPAPVGAGWYADPDDSRLIRYWDGAAWTEHRRHAVRPTPGYAPSSAPNLWTRFKAWPLWAQLATAAVTLLLLIGVVAGDDSGDDGSNSERPSAEQAAGTESVAEEAEAEERERARERKRARARKKARERERIRERRRERRREEARERRRRDREARPAPAEEPPADPGGDCDPNYSPCVPPYPPDLDCPDVGGPVTVKGSDPHGLDADNDGKGCES
jgi:hypothetical protein